MAIAIRGTTPLTTGVVTSDPISVTLDSARQPNAGDVLVIIHCNNFYNVSNMVTPTVAGSSTGVTAITGGAATGTTADTGGIKSYTYVVGSTGDLTVAEDETGAANEEKLLAVYVLSGVDTATPVDIAGNFNGAPSGGLYVCPSVSPTSSDAFLICHYNTCGGAASGLSDPPSGMTEQYDAAVGGMSTAGASVQLVTSGATGTKLFDPVDSPVGDTVGISVAVKTGGAPPPAPDLFVVRSGVTLA